MAIETHIHAFPRHVASKTYPEAVPVYDTTAKRIRVGDGSTVGGTEIPNMADLNGKAAAADVTALAGRVTSAEGTIADHTTALAGKADQSDLSDLSDRVGAAETAIRAKAAAADVTALAGRVTSLESALGSFESQARAILGEEES